MALKQHDGLQRQCDLSCDFCLFLHEHSSCRKCIMHDKWGHSIDNGFIFKKNKYKREKYILGSFRIYQLISTANQAQFYSNRAGLAVLISWQNLNGPKNLFLFFIFLFDFLNMKPQSIECPHFFCILNCLQLLCEVLIYFFI